MLSDDVCLQALVFFFLCWCFLFFLSLQSKSTLLFCPVVSLVLQLIIIVVAVMDFEVVRQGREGRLCPVSLVVAEAVVIV